MRNQTNTANEARRPPKPKASGSNPLSRTPARRRTLSRFLPVESAATALALAGGSRLPPDLAVSRPNGQQRDHSHAPYLPKLVRGRMLGRCAICRRLVRVEIPGVRQ